MIYLRFNFRLISKDNEKIFNKYDRPFLSAKFKAFANQVSWEAKSQYKGTPLTNNLTVLLLAYFKNKKHCDLFNLPKGAMDALQGVIFENDSQIKKGMIEVIENSKEDWFEIYVQEN